MPFSWVYTPWAEHPSAARLISASSITGVTRRTGLTPTLFCARSSMSACACIEQDGEDNRFYKYLAAATGGTRGDSVGTARALQVRHCGQHLLHGTAFSALSIAT